MNENQLTLCASFVIFLILLGFGASLAGIYDNRNYYVANNVDCPVFPLLDKFQAEKHYDQWTWRYKVRNGDYHARVEHYCPTTQHDTNVFIDGKFAGRSDGKILTTVSKTFVRDCHGKKKFVMRTGDMFETIVNMNKIFVSFELRDYKTDASGEENDVIAYVEQFSFFYYDFTIRDKYDAPIAKLYMNKYQFQWWTWEFTIYNKTHPAANPMILLMIAGKASFSETTTDDNGDEQYNTDICNNYFWTMSLIMIIILCVIGLFVLCAVVFGVTKWWNNRDHYSTNSNYYLRIT